MKFNFWKKDKKETNEVQDNINSVFDRSDESIFYDYDKVTHNQFLTPNAIKNKFIENEIQSKSEYAIKYGQANVVARGDDQIIEGLKKDINERIKIDEQQYKVLYTKSHEINEAGKIPIKKRTIFVKKVNDDNVEKSYSNVDNSSYYNIVEEPPKKFDNKVDYYSLKKDQTKLLDLDEILSEDKKDNIDFNNEQSFVVDKTKSSEFTNRLFQGSNEEVASTTRSESESNSNNIQINEIPRKTIKLSFEKTNSFETPSQDNNFNSARIINQSLNQEVKKTKNTTSIFSNQDSYQRIPTTALRYLTPIEDVAVESERVKKENRRFIKFIKD